MRSFPIETNRKIWYIIYCRSMCDSAFLRRLLLRREILRVSSLGAFPWEESTGRRIGGSRWHAGIADSRTTARQFRRRPFSGLRLAKPCCFYREE